MASCWRSATYKEVRLVDPETGKVIATLTGRRRRRARGGVFAGWQTAGGGGRPARALRRSQDLGRREARRAAHHQGSSDCIYAVAFSPDGKSIATSSYDKLIKLWNVESGQGDPHVQRSHRRGLRAGVHAGWQAAGFGAADRTVKVWDVATGERLYTLSEPQDGLNTIALDPSGQARGGGRVWTRRFASGHWARKAGTLLNSLIAHEDAILQLAWSPDGKYLISTSADTELKVFKADDLSKVKTLQPAGLGAVAGVCAGWQNASRRAGSMGLSRFTTGILRECYWRRSMSSVSAVCAARPSAQRRPTGRPEIAPHRRPSIRFRRWAWRAAPRWS